MADENEDQRALRKWIAAGLAIPEVVQGHGDARYLLANMIAKYTLSADAYAISERALARMAEDGVDLAVRHARSRFYGKASPYIYEHAVPAGIVMSALLEGDRSAEVVALRLAEAGGVAVLLREEDAKLRRAGLARRMPDGWAMGDDKLARYAAVDVRLSDRLLQVKGRIMR